MRKSLFLLPLVCVAVACGASSGTVTSATKDAEARGFTVLSERNGDAPFEDAWVDMEVSFGEGGCTGEISSDGEGVRLSIDLLVAGSTTETTPTTVSNPRVEKLRKNPAFANCFKKQP